MAKFLGNDIGKIIFDGSEISKAYLNGQIVYESNPFAYNTVIGGIGGSVTTAALLAAQLTNLVESDIKNFRIVGSDVYFQVNKTYTLTGNTMRVGGGRGVMDRL